MIRLAAVGDVHFGEDSAGTLRPHLKDLSERADVLLLAGDLTHVGRAAEGAVLARELSGLGVPCVAVLGNHDYHLNEQDEIRHLLTECGVRVLEGETCVLDVGGQRLGIAGTKGFGGGFAGACGSDFGEPEMKAFIEHTKLHASRLEQSLRSLDADRRIALLHYSPIEGTLHGERLEIYPFLGSYLLAEAIDRAGADIVFHGHAHAGTEKGVTPGGIPVRNVSQPLIRHAFNLYVLDGEASPEMAQTSGGRTSE
ncbi:MAG TPA: metallophosphoesterase [Actinomycetota bacterium]|nr:metallophosphoesterase [Actinomycetota bacterium]